MSIFFAAKVKKGLCTTPVEKSVENVKNSKLSTAFRPVNNSLWMKEVGAKIGGK